MQVTIPVTWYGMGYSLENHLFVWSLNRKILALQIVPFFLVRFQPAMQENVEEHHGWWGTDLEL